MLAKSGPLHEAERAVAGGLVLLEDVRAGDVRGHQVRRELDAVEGQVEHVRQRGDEQRLGQAGHAHEEAVAAAEERDEQVLDHVALADDALLDLLDDLRPGLGELLDGAEVLGRERLLRGGGGGGGAFHKGFS